MICKIKISYLNKLVFAMLIIIVIMLTPVVAIAGDPGDTDSIGSGTVKASGATGGERPSLKATTTESNVSLSVSGSKPTASESPGIESSAGSTTPTGINSDSANNTNQNITYDSTVGTDNTSAAQKETTGNSGSPAKDYTISDMVDVSDTDATEAVQSYSLSSEIGQPENIKDKAGGSKSESAVVSQKTAADNDAVFERENEDEPNKSSESTGSSGSNQTFTTELTPDVVVGLDADTAFSLTIEEVGSSDIAEVAIHGNDFVFVSLDNVSSTDGLWNGSIDSINNILNLFGTALQAGQSVTADFTATTPATAGIYNFDVDVTDSGGISNSPQTQGLDDQPSVWVAGASHNVAPSDSIQSAIDTAQPYDIINVQPGTYEENLVINDTTGLLLRSAVKHGAVIDGVNFGRGVTLLEFKPTDHYTISDIRIEGFKFKDIPIPSGGAASTGHGIAMFTDKIIANITIADNLFDNTNPLTTENHKGAAILIDNVDGLLIENNTMLDTALYMSASPEEVAAITLHQFFDSNYLNDIVVKNNTIVNATRGIWVGEGFPNNNRFFNDVLIEGNHIEQIAREGIRADVGADAGNETLIIRNNQLKDTYRTIRIGAVGSGGIVMVDSNNITTTAGPSVYGISVENGQVVIMDNIISGQETGIFVKAGVLTPPVINGNNFADNILQVHDNSGSINLDNNLTANIFDRAAVVRDSNTNSIKVPIIFSSIQDAIDMAITGDTVNVYPGIYERHLIITTDDLRIQSASGRDNTFITGIHSQFPGFAEVVLVGINGNRVVFEGFTLQGTYTGGHDYTVSVYGDGVQILNNEIIGDPGSPNMDVGIQVWRGSDGANLEGNIIRTMSHSGISVGGSTLATNVRIHNNQIYDTARDYGIAVDRAPGSIVSGNYVENVGHAGIYVVNRAGRSVAGTVVEGNTVTNNPVGIRIRDAGAPVEGVELTGNTISGNQIGIYLEGTDISGAIAHSNSIVGNFDYGISNQSASIFNARNNWWGDPGGPSTHPDDFTAPDGYVLDPETFEPADGLGDAVSVNVFFDPWLESEPTPPSPQPQKPDLALPAGFAFLVLPEFEITVPAIRSLIFGPAPVVTVQFVTAGTSKELVEAIIVYERYRQAFEKNKEELDDREYAEALIELNVAWAAILVLEAKLKTGSEARINLDAVIEAYDKAADTLKYYGHHLSKVQMDLVTMIMAAVVNSIASLRY